MSSNSIEFSERYIARGKARIYARDYAGVGPAFVLMHGFPDNLHIWDDLIPYLVASGRRVVAFDFLGFGSSDKPADAAYSFQQQLADLEAIVEGLGLGKIVPVAHDSSGMATLNYALTHPDGVDSAIIRCTDRFPIFRCKSSTRSSAIGTDVRSGAGGASDSGSISGAFDRKGYHISKIPPSG